MPAPHTTSKPYVRQRRPGPHWYAKWSRHGKPVVRALGPAWVEPDGHGGFAPRRGRPRGAALTEAQASARMLLLVGEHDRKATAAEQEAETRGPLMTFRELAHEWLAWVEDVKGAKPSTLRGYRSLLAEPGERYRRGSGTTEGLIMAELGDFPAAD